MLEISNTHSYKLFFFIFEAPLRPPRLKMMRNSNARMRLWWRLYKSIPVDYVILKIFPSNVPSTKENTKVQIIKFCKKLYGFT